MKRIADIMTGCSGSPRHCAGLVPVVLAAGLSSLAVAGCYESPGANVYEAGDYKGKSDPLLDKLQTNELQHHLVERFQMGQTDR